ncbi:MAG: MBL fold metallo-hydrolase [Eudoraea sp.]|nr:MBL fold metallo-hydrolase [Eudoraea sp.]
MSVSNVEITVIADNLVLKSGLWGQWGLSYLIKLTDSEGEQRKVLFDTGNDTWPFLYNIEKLELSLEGLDAIILSHGHLDHTVATVEAIEMSGSCNVYAHPHCFQKRYFETKKGKKRDIGVPNGQGIKEIKAAGGNLILTSDPVEVIPGLWTTGQVPRINDFEFVDSKTDSGERIIMVEGERREDLILCDQSLWMDVDGTGCWTITGCAHSGPVNTLTQVKKLGGFQSIYAYIGGTHLVGKKDDYILKTADEMSKFGLDLVAPCHCTVFNAMSLMHKEFGDKFMVNYCGRIIKSWEKPTPMVF